MLYQGSEVFRQRFSGVEQQMGACWPLGSHQERLGGEEGGGEEERKGEVRRGEVKRRRGEEGRRLEEHVVVWTHWTRFNLQERQPPLPAAEPPFPRLAPPLPPPGSHLFLSGTSFLKLLRITTISSQIITVNNPSH